MSTRENPGWMTEKERRRRRLPKHCECGGRMLYNGSLGRVWSVCERCTPVVEIDVSKLTKALS